MEILVVGSARRPRKYTGCCPECGTVFECLDTETRTVQHLEENDLARKRVVTCPLSGCAETVELFE